MTRNGARRQSFVAVHHSVVASRIRSRLRVSVRRAIVALPQFSIKIT